MPTAFFKIYFIPAIILFCFVATAFGQVPDQLKDQRFERLSTSNGLSTNQVVDIIQDKEGFYWISTLNGLNRFDGSSFRVFRHSKNDSISINHNVCNFLLEGNDGDIWIGTRQGVCRFRKKTGVFKRYYFHDVRSNDDVLNRINGLAKDGEGNIWAASSGLWKINPVDNSVEGFLHNGSDITTLSDSLEISSLYYDSLKNGLWMITPDAINFFDPVSGKFYHRKNNPHQWPIFNLPGHKPLLTLDKDQRVWTYDEKEKKLSCFYQGSYSFKSLFFDDEIGGLSADREGNLIFITDMRPALFYNWKHNIIDSMPALQFENTSPVSRVITRTYTDYGGNKWFCSSEGLYVATKSPDNMNSYLLDKDAAGFPHAIWSIAEQPGKLWLGTKKGLFLYEPATHTLRPSAHKFLDKDIRTLYNAGDSVLWVSSRNQVVLLNIANNKVLKKVTLPSYPYFITSDKWGHFWIGTFTKGLFELDGKGEILNQYTDNDGLNSSFLISCYIEKGAVLWIGMNGGNGFARFDIASRKFENFLITSDKQTPAEINTVNALTMDAAGNLWLGTYGGGIYFFNRTNGQFRNYRQSDGLSGDYVNTLTIDKAGNLWISGFYGIDKMEVKTKTIYHVNETIQYDNLDYINNLLVGRLGNLFYIANGKIIVIDPLKYMRGEAGVKILISNFNLAGKELHNTTAGNSYRFPYNQNFLTLEFSVLKVSPNIPAQYKYKMQGWQDNWSFSNNRGVVNYTNIPPGEYSLLLNATNETGKWNEKPVVIHIRITPPFWKTWWFYLLSFFLTAALLIFSVRNRLRQLKKIQQDQLRLVVATQEREKKSISAELHDDLGVRLSALKYFVSSLKKYLQPNDPLALETYSKTISIIDESVEDVRYLLINLSPKTLNEYGYLVAVEDLVNKLSRTHILNISLEQKGIDKRMEAEVEAGLYRITQELINNTLKHANATAVHLNIERINECIKVNYSDDGQGFDPSQNGRGYGMENIHTRVALLNGKIEWDAGAGRPTKVNITIPYNHTLG